ncbi:protein LONGIFOLIA 1-like isoform X2 [Humulus lupulus]|uniref:protein LONGIFOLIA 1-like isoform X2 n=1 Tax=Humulus lupulus TaxID=3486 RepID=UPI002B4146E6|nr:protein LONGIFOLIA 1-like isoform X2 [Humulus lupulus]
MSTKLIYSLSDENPDLQKQIGCMNGFFQLFDRHRYLASGRVNSHSQKGLPPPGQNDNQAVEPDVRLEKASEKNAKKKVVKEKQRNSTESPRVSVSSSCSSTFSSVEYKTSQQEPSPSSQATFVETPPRNQPAKQLVGSTQLSRKSLDLRDVVKDSMHREARGLLVKTTTKEAAFHTLKYIDSPRPSEPAKSVKPKISGLNESFRVFGRRSTEGPRNSHEGRDDRVLSRPKDLRRLSYDGKELQDTLKSTAKFKELPRLSLDSRQSSIRGSNSEAKSAYLLNDLRMEKRNCVESTAVLQEPGSSKRASSVIAKLMGLVEPMPTTDDLSSRHNTLETEKSDPLSKSSGATNINRHDHFSGSPKNFQKDPTSQMKNGGSVAKITANQKIPMETAPWRQPHGNKGSQPPAFKCYETPTKVPTTPLTVYGEIEKRLADLEFKKSGKDLRALKQILEAMQKTKDTLDNKKDKKFMSGASDNGSDHSSNLGSSQRNLQSNTSTSPTAKGFRAPKHYNSPIVVIKPTKLLGKNTPPACNISSIDNLHDSSNPRTRNSAENRNVSVEKRVTKHLNPRNTQVTDAFNRHHSSQDKNNTKTTRSAQNSKMTHSDSEENSASSGTMSPRLQQRRFGLDKQSAPASPDSSRTRRQLSRQPIECSSPGRKCRPKPSNMQRDNNQLCGTRTYSRDLCYQDNSISLQSESSISLASDVDNEVTSIMRADKISSIYCERNGLKPKNPTVGFTVNRTMTETGKATSEQPSPVSVLDAFYRDESPSPVKKKSNAFKDDETPCPNEVDWELMDIYQPSNGRKSNLSSEVDYKTLAYIWAQTTQEMNCTDLEQIIANNAVICDSTNPDHIYISDILSASNLFRKFESDWMDIQFYSSYQLINPNMFFALEQLTARTQLSHNEHRNEKSQLQKNDKKVNRKLVFDVVNEILVNKFVETNLFMQWLSPDKVKWKRPNGQQLLKDLCSEIDQLQGNSSSSSLDENGLGSIICEDMTQWPMNLSDYGREIPAVVLDVERLIFKDLINEVLSDKAAIMPCRSGGHCRQLFPK